MKKLIALIISLMSLTAFANDVALCEYLKTETLEKVHGSLFHSTAESKEYGLVRKVDEKLKERIKEQCRAGELRVVKDYDTCSSLCVEHGSSDLRVKAMFKTNGLVDLNKETRACQRACKIYQYLAFTYRDGLKAGGKSSDCSEGVSSADRNIVKDISVSDKKDLQKSSATKQ